MKTDKPHLPVISSVLTWRRFPLSTILATFAVLLLLWHIRTTSFSGFQTSSSNSRGIHPIYKRMLEANDTYHSLLNRQSKTLSQARRQYVKRYHMPPPEGFDQWHAYATAQKSLIIDDFDVINEKLQPFRQYLKGGCGMKELDAGFLGRNHLIQICIRNGNLTFHGDEKAEWITAAFTGLISTFITELPDVCVIMNLLDEPRILLPADRKVQDLKEHTFCPVPSFVSYEKQQWWTEAVLNCPPTSPARLYPGKPDPTKKGKLQEDFMSTSDLCEYSVPMDHGILLSPSSLLATHSVVPIISNAGLSTFSDIFFPSLWRFDLYDEEYNRTQDIAWAKKANNGYWRGSTTGGQAQANRWDKFQRHRFVDYVNDKQNGLTNTTDVKFSNIVQCDEEACKELEAHYVVDKKRPFSDTLKSKIVFDIDGNGLSGRFYPLLRSNSAVFRQGIFREWHDGRIFPWIHYVPLSLEFTELKELMDFYLGDGEVLLERVASEGREMAETVLRREDMRIYFYRLLIEMGRRD